jgi:hypothetical protein
VNGNERKGERPRRRPRSWVFHAIFLAAAFVLGVVVIAKKVGAAAPPSRANALGPAALVPAIAPATLPAIASATPGESIAPARPSPSKADAKADERVRETGAEKRAEKGPEQVPEKAAERPSEAVGQAAGEKAADGAYEDPLSYTFIQSEEDFDPDMSDEEKTAIGTGKVPIHREGPFKSPLAHPRFGGATNTKVGLVIREIRDFSIQTGGFEAEFFLSLTGDKELPPVNPVFTNGHEVTLTPLVDAPTFKLYQVSGKFTAEVDLRNYPFDKQALDIDFEDAKAGIDQIVFEPDANRTSLDSAFKLTGFGVASVTALAYKHKYPPRFDRDDLYVSRYRFIVNLERYATSAAFSVYVPAFIIVLISLMGMWVVPEELEVRSNAGAPMLAAAVLFHYSLVQELPATAYLTPADKLMLGVYLSLLLNMGSTWALLLGDEEWAMKVFTQARLWVPIATAVIMALACIL